jgi:biopolymer transport protein ExbD
MTLKLKSRLKHRALIDITSLIDLVFLLVAFFMVTSSLGSESSITVHLPKAEQTAQYKGGDIVVSINERNEIFINDVAYTKETIIEELKRLKAEKGELSVVIRGDRKADYEMIVTIMDRLNQAGIPKFTIATTD